MAKILIVDDTPANREFLVTLLGYGGHVLLEAADGAEGLAQARVELPDLVIADILMPTMDGFEFVRQLREEPNRVLAATPVIFYTAAYHEQEARVLARDRGVEYVLTKPSEPEDILKTVDAALGRQAASEPEALDPQPSAEFSREHLRLLTNKLAQKVKELETTGLRLHALVKIGQQLAAQRDPERLLRDVCAGARDILGAQVATMGLIEDDGVTLRQFVTDGLDADSVMRMSPPDPRLGVIHTIVTERRAQRRSNPGGDPRVLGFPGDHQRIYSYLAVPVATQAHFYGWLGLRNKLDANAFSDDDERLALMLSGQVALAYENARHAADLEQRVLARTFDLQRSNEELEQFAYLASHDLQEPLRKVLGFAGLLSKRYAGQLDAEANEFIAFIVDGASRMRDLIEDLLEFSRVGTRSTDPEAAGAKSPPLDSEHLLEQVLASLSTVIKETQALVTSDPLPAVYMEPHEFVQVFQNLIANAIKFHGLQPPRVHLSAEPYLVEGNEAMSVTWMPDGRPAPLWLFSVRDNGVGFDPQFSERIFRMFQRLHRRDEYPGTGIGLAVCRKVIERHGGRIWVDSQAGQGATFYFTLPSDPNMSKLERRAAYAN